MRQSIWMNVYDTVSCATTLCEDFIFLPLFLKLSIQDFPTSILWTGIGRPHHTLLYCCADPAWLCSCIYRVFFFDEKLKSFWDLYYPNKMHILVSHYKNGVEPRSATEIKYEASFNNCSSSCKPKFLLKVWRTSCWIQTKQEDPAWVFTNKEVWYCPGPVRSRGYKPTFRWLLYRWGLRTGKPDF